MQMYERIKVLRKNHLNLSQEAFGKQLGVSRSVINNIERNALARPEQKLSLIKLICKEFSVNEDWLLNGNEPIFVESDTFSLNEYAKQHNITELELKVIKSYFELDPDIRKILLNHFKKIFTDTSVSDDLAATAATVPEAEVAYIKSRSNIAPNTDLSASNTTTDNNTKKISNE